MKIIETPIPDLVEIIPTIFGDHRGYFYESYNEKSFAEKGLSMSFVQDNQSLSGKGVL
ncbi:MAG: dTDP-4-dehydrorhamnose 3,5-epimerase family protein, partial [Owenweeksia sp.]